MCFTAKRGPLFKSDQSENPILLCREPDICAIVRARLLSYDFMGVDGEVNENETSQLDPVLKIVQRSGRKPPFNVNVNISHPCLIYSSFLSVL